METPTCRHYFCKFCIIKYLGQKSRCPVDKVRLTSSDLKEASEVVTRFLGQLELSCDFASAGCESVIPLKDLSLRGVSV